jgi:hypothetical protein
MCASDSLFPLFSNTDNVFDAQLLGEWIVQGGTREKDSQEASGHFIFQKYGGGTNYQITIPDFDEQGA